MPAAEELTRFRCAVRCLSRLALHVYGVLRSRTGYPGPRHYTPRVVLKFRDGKRIMYEQADRTFHFTSLMLYAEVRLRHETQTTTTGPCFIFFMCAGVGLEERSLFCTSLRL